MTSSTMEPTLSPFDVQSLLDRLGPVRAFCVQCADGITVAPRRLPAEARRYPANLRQGHVDRLLADHPHLRGTKAARLPETLRDWAVMSA